LSAREFANEFPQGKASKPHSRRIVNDLPQFLQLMLLSFAAIRFSGYLLSRRRAKIEAHSFKPKTISSHPN